MFKGWVSRKSLSEIAGMTMMMMRRRRRRSIQQHAKQSLLCRGYNSAAIPHGFSARIVAPMSTDFIVQGFDDSLPARKPIITGLQRRGFGNVGAKLSLIHI